MTNGLDMGIGTTFHTDILAPGGANERLGLEHGDGYLDIRSFLVVYGLRDAEIAPTAQDIADMEADIVPASIRAPQSTGHLNAAGQKVAADQIVLHMQRVGGWFI